MIVLNANVGLVRIPMDVPMQAFHKSSKWQSEADDDAVDSDKISTTNQSPCEFVAARNLGRLKLPTTAFQRVICQKANGA